MRGWMRVLLLAALACAAGACARAGEIAAPDGAGARMDGGAPQDPAGATTTSDSSSGGRWGGFIGSGG